MTTRGLKERDFEKLAIFFDRAIKIGVDLKKLAGENISTFTKICAESEELKALKEDVEKFTENFQYPFFDHRIHRDEE